MSIDPDSLRAASHRNMTEHLCGPFIAGALDNPLAIAADGQVATTIATREPLIVVAPLTSLAQTTLLLDAHVVNDGTALQQLVFAPYSEEGAFLPLYIPAVDEQTRMTPPFGLSLALTEVAADGTKTAIAAAAISERLEVRLIEGNIGRLLFIQGCEKLRLRRLGREIAAMRQLSLARDDALDRYGAELGVPRFTDAISYDAEKHEIVTIIRRDAQGKIIPEPDSEYRRRLKLYRPFRMNTRKQVNTFLNGPGKTGDPNAGLLSGLGLAQRFDILETDDEFAITIHLIGTSAEQQRTAFLSYLSATFLIWPYDNVPNNDLHARRFLPDEVRARIETLRTNLRTFFNVDSTIALAPMLALALERLGLCRAALGVNSQILIYRGLQSNAGSRYELGLGADLQPIKADDLNSMRDQLLAQDRHPAADPEIEALLRSMQPLTAAEDPEGSWLLRACGLRTVHRLASDRIYVSHLPTFGLVILGPDTVALNTDQLLEARYNAPLDPGGNVVLVTGMDAVTAGWQAAGEPAWQALNSQEASPLWDKVTANENALRVFQRAGLPALPKPGDVVPSLKALPQELIITLRLADTQAQAILAGSDAAVTQLVTLVNLLKAHNLASALPLVTSDGQVLLVVGVIGLPGAGVNLSDTRTTGFRWYVVPIKFTALSHFGGELTNRIGAVGSRTTFTAFVDGIYAIVVVGYARHGLTSPYQFHVDLPDDTLLSIQQYEFLMNILQQSFPIGVEINTLTIRQRHVDLDGDGKADVLSPAIFRTYRQFQQRRNRGEIGVTLQ
jgi:hypothetical protein